MSFIDIIQSSDDDDNLFVKDAQKKKKQLETRLKNLEYDTEQDDNIYFENLGVDALLLMKHIISKSFHKHKAVKDCRHTND